VSGVNSTRFNTVNHLVAILGVSNALRALRHAPALPDASRSHRDHGAELRSNVPKKSSTVATSSARAEQPFPMHAVRRRSRLQEECHEPAGGAVCVRGGAARGSGHRGGATQGGVRRGGAAQGWSSAPQGRRSSHQRASRTEQLRAVCLKDGAVHGSVPQGRSSSR
jgi:hypothetical protein